MNTDSLSESTEAAVANAMIDIRHITEAQLAQLGLQQIAGNRWLPDRELAVYAGEYQRNGFQGGLQWYRRGTGGLDTAELQLFAGRTIDVPSLFIAGTSDWGIYQNPGAFERMQEVACTRMAPPKLIEGAGHWVQQEQAEQVGERLVAFLKR